MTKPLLQLLYQDNNRLPPLVESPPEMVAVEPISHSTNRSIETLVVVVAVIIIVSVIAGLIARLCGGRRHFDGNNNGDMESWVERRCRSCIDSGVQPAPLKPEPAAAVEETEK